MFILDSATADDAKAGYGWTGNYTSIIKSLCKDNGINYEQTYRTLLFKQQLEYGGKKVKEKRAALLQAKSSHNYEEILRNEILQIRPRVIVPLGEHAFNYVTLEKGISKFRGSILPLRSDIQSVLNPGIVRVIPTLPPEYIYGNPITRIYVSLDYVKIKKATLESGPIQNNLIIWVADSPEKFSNYIRRVSGNYGVFDIESKFNIPVCIGFAFCDTEGCTVPLLDNQLNSSERTILWQMVDRFLRSHSWINQNIKYDTLLLERFGFEIKNIIGDTALRQSIIYPELPKNLGFLNSIYNDIPYFKDEGKDAGNREQLYLYCAKDCVSTYQIYHKQEEDLRDLGLHQFERKIQSLFWPYIRIERRGILIDAERLDRLRIYYEGVYYTHLQTLRKMVENEGFNPHSPLQVSTLIYDELRYPIRKNRKTGGLATDEETLEELYTFHKPGRSCDFVSGKSILELIIGCRKLHKVIEYCETPIHPDNRMRGSYDLGGTKTGRSACKSTTDYLLIKNNGKFETTEIGRSLQTIGKHGFQIGGIWYGKDLRSIFVPTPDYIFVEGDLSQAEARVDAVLAKDFDFLSKFDIKPGVHVLTGEWVFGYTIDKKSEPDKYHIAKTVRHAGERNMGPDRLAMMIQKDLPFCKNLLDKFHAAQPSIRKVFHKDVIDFITANRYLISPHGRRRDFFGKPGYEMFNEAISQIPQATVSDQIKFSLPLLEDAVPYAMFNYEGHDALMSEIKLDQVQDYCAHFRRIVERNIDFRNCSLSRDFDLSIPCELSYSGEAWQNMKGIEEIL
jgi:DNA polymerase I-like protein with 3'-5' exonuclease and polymerase domains/uracil-DNA glycosylase